MILPPSINLICILGPTASGKTALAAHFAHDVGGEIISADSRQVYRGMNIGTGKDYQDYKVDNSEVPYHLIDIAEAGEEYNVFQYQKDFYRVFTDIRERLKIPVLCGGSGMYIESVLNSYQLLQVPINDQLRGMLSQQDSNDLAIRLKSYKNPHNTTDTLIRKRLIRAIEIEEYLQGNPSVQLSAPEIRPVIIGISIDREARRNRITSRLKQRLENGMIEETAKLMSSGIPPEKLEYYGLEYKYLSRFVQGFISYEEMFNSLNTAIHQFAKRQMTWFRKMEREGAKINWIEWNTPMEQKILEIKKLSGLSG